ncbi:MAG: SpoIIE family protein phosphatase [Planctomycetes bacterium]|nr:SpoIIE family protein phosphatase [Planctomycetota bacterium]
MRILVKELDNVIFDLAFEREPIHIGSQPGCSVHLPDMRINLVHAILSPSGERGWTIEHTAGEAKTWVNGHVLQQPQEVSHGDQITIEDYTLNIYLETLDDDLGKTRAPAKAASRIEHEFPLPAGAIVRSRRESLSLSPAQIDNLARFAHQLGTCADIAAMMETVLVDLGPRFMARAVWIGVRRQGRGRLDYIQGRDYNDNVFDRPKLYDSLLNRCVGYGAGVWIPQLEDDDATSIIAAPIVSPQGRLGLIYLDSKKSGDPFSERDFDYLLGLSSVIAAHLDLLVRGEIQRRKALTSAESSIVQAIQAQLDPKGLPEWPTLQVAAHSKPGQDAASDVYDLMQMPNGAAAFFLAQVSAKPVAAAMAMIEARAAFRVAVLHSDMPHVMLQELNWLICARQEKIAMQCGIVLVDPKNGALLHSNAGASCAVVVGQSGQPRRLASSANPPPLGTAPDRQYVTGRGLLGKNESLAMYSRGVMQLQNEDRTALTEHRFFESLCDGFGMAARTALDETLTDLNTYSERGYQPADVTVLLAHRPADQPAEI